MLQSSSDSHSGKILLGKYRCAGVIAHSAYATVYRAQHVKLKAMRAIKILRSEHRDDPAMVEAFWREAAIAAGFRHPNITLVYDIDSLPDTTPCSIWELVEGETLAQRIARQPLAAQASTIARGLCAALQALHESDIVHLDLCPDNVLLANEGGALLPRLVDFSAARKLGQIGDRGSAPLRLGFSAPEQLETGVPIDTRADVFSLGALLCFAFTGKPPMQPRDVETYRRELSTLDPSQLRVVGELPPALRPIVTECLQPEAQRRPRDASAVRAAIRKAARDSSTTDHPSLPSLPPPPTPPAGPAPGAFPGWSQPAMPSADGTAPVSDGATLRVARDAVSPTATVPYPFEGDQPHQFAPTEATPRAPLPPGGTARAPANVGHVGLPDTPEVSPSIVDMPAEQPPKSVGHVDLPDTPEVSPSIVDMPADDDAGPPPANLEPVAGDSRGPCALNGNDTIGRQLGNSVRLSHPTVSKRHAVIRYHDRTFYIADLGSRNGTSVNGRSVREEIPLRDGDTVVLGDVVFRFRTG